MATALVTQEEERAFKSAVGVGLPFGLASSAGLMVIEHIKQRLLPGLIPVPIIGSVRIMEAIYRVRLMSLRRK